MICLPAHATDWYVAKEATGANNGTSWANAWTNVDRIVWPSVLPGDTVWLSGGPSGGTNVYIGNLSTYNANANNGTQASPITIKVATDSAHNGLVKIVGAFYIGRNWYTVDGSKSSWTPISVLDTYGVPTNCNLEVSNTNQTHAVNFGACTGAKLYWVHASAAGSYKDSGDHNGIEFNGNAGGGRISNAEIAYCWVSDAWGFGIEASGFASATWGQLAVHHCLVERVHDNYMQADGYSDWYANVFRNWISPTVGHPDGFQGIAAFTRIYNNIVSDQPGTAIYIEANGDDGFHDFYAYNNLFYTTPQGASTINWHDGMTITGHDAITNSPLLISNVWVFNNTFHDLSGSTVFIWNLGTIRVSGSVSNLHFLNNAIILVPPNNTYSVLFFLTNNADENGNRGFSYKTADVEVDYNNISGGTTPWGRGIFYGAKGDYFAQSPYPNFLQFGAATGYPHNNNTTAGYVSVANLNFTLSGDTALTGLGTNLSALAVVAPGCTSDILGNLRGPSWNIGAGGVNISAVSSGTRTRPAPARNLVVGDKPPSTNAPGLIMQLDFNSWPGATDVTDTSGNGNNALVFGTAINKPTVGVGPDGSSAAHFVTTSQGHNDVPYAGNYLAVTNLNGMDRLTNGTIMVWAWYDTNSDSEVALLDGGYEILEPNSFRLWRDFWPNTLLSIYDSTGTKHDLVGFPDYTTTNATTGWHHYVVTWDTSTVTSYFDGTNVMSAAQVVPFLRVGSQFHWLAIGCWHHEGTPQYDLPEQFPNCGWFSGYMDDVRIYNRTLSASEISAVYKQVRP